jgi:aldehyde dehydrogenase (NAD+)
VVLKQARRSIGDDLVTHPAARVVSFTGSSAMHTADAERGTRFALRLNAGMTHVNDSPVNEEDNTAYGGEKLSGLGRFGGSWSVDEFTTHHWMSVQHTRRPYPLPAPA